MLAESGTSSAAWRGTATAGSIGSSPTMEWIRSETAVPSGSRSES